MSDVTIAVFENVARVEVRRCDEDYDWQTNLAELEDSSFLLALIAPDGTERIIGVYGGNGGAYGVSANWPEPDLTAQPCAGSEAI